MKLVGELKNKVEKTETLEDAKKIIEDAGMQLSDEELDTVAGGHKARNQEKHHHKKMLDY